jgi:membrane protein YdbS with pleckstrin-like domain
MLNQTALTEASKPRAIGAPAGLDAERVLWEGSPSWKSDFWKVVGVHALVYALVIGSGIVFYLYSNKTWWLGLIPLGFAVIGAFYLFAHYLYRRSSKLRIGTHTIDIETGLLGRTIDTLQLWRVRDIEFEQSATERLLGIARIRILSHDEKQPTLVLAGIPGKKQLFLDLRDAISIARQGRNVIGMVD